MEAGIPARLSPAAEGRSFGLTVGTAFAVFGGITMWRGHPTAAATLGALAALLVLGGLLIPRQMLPVQAAWMRLALAISRVTTPIIMSVLYLGVLLPAGVLRRTFGRSALVHEAIGDSLWKPREEGKRRSELHRQF